jgi:hypothetical protein
MQVLVLWMGFSQTYQLNLPKLPKIRGGEGGNELGR